MTVADTHVYSLPSLRGPASFCFSEENEILEYVWKTTVHSLNIFYRYMDTCNNVYMIWQGQLLLRGKEPGAKQDTKVAGPNPAAPRQGKPRDVRGQPAAWGVRRAPDEEAGSEVTPGGQFAE